MPLLTPIGNNILDSVKEALLSTRKQVGEEYFFGAKLVTRAPGVSPKWFENPEWNMAYWVVCPEERVTEQVGAHRFESVMEVFIVGAKAGRWTIQPENQRPPTREETQIQVAHDIKKSILVDFRRGANAINSNLTNVKYSFTAWPNFAIVSTRWEISYLWFREQP
jgi:hypothetical protein